MSGTLGEKLNWMQKQFKIPSRDPRECEVQIQARNDGQRIAYNEIASYIEQSEELLKGRGRGRINRSTASCLA